MRLRYLAPALVALLAVLAAACGGGDDSSTAFVCDAPAKATAPDAAAYPLDVTDSVGNTVTLKAPPERVVSLSAGHTETLYAIGAGDQVVAVDLTSDCPQATAKLPKENAFSPSVETIASVNPDLVIIFFDPGDLQSSLQGVDIPVLNLAAPDSVEGVYDQMALLGKATGHSEEAERLAGDMKKAVEEVRSRLKDGPEAPTVFHEVDNKYFSAGPGSFIGDLYDILGAENIAGATGEAFPQMSAEAIIKADPDVIILADEDAGETADTVKARPGWGSISAVKNDRIYVIDADTVSRPGPRLVEALRALAGYLYPERFR